MIMQYINVIVSMRDLNIGIIQLIGDIFFQNTGT